MLFLHKRPSARIVPEFFGYGSASKDRTIEEDGTLLQVPRAGSYGMAMPKTSTEVW